MTNGEWAILISVAVILISQGSWMFYDAAKRNENKWLWGFFGLIHFPSSIIIYLLVTRRLNRRMTCPNCLYSIPKDSLYCKYCGHEISEEERQEGIKIRIETENNNK